MTVTAPRTALSQIIDPNRVEASLWRRLKFENKSKCRDELFSKYMDFARILAKKEFRSRSRFGLEFEDFEHFAFAGLLQAIDRYDPTRGASFKSFAYRRIRGSIIDGIRQSSEDASFCYRAKAKAQERSASILEASTNTDTALSRLSEIVVGLAIGYIIEGEIAQTHGHVADSSPNAYETLAWKELKQSIVRNVENLPDKENLVVKRHYFQGLAFKQIALLLQVTKGRVSQIHKSAINILRKRLKSRNG